MQKGARPGAFGETRRKRMRRSSGNPMNLRSIDLVLDCGKSFFYGTGESVGHVVAMCICATAYSWRSKPIVSKQHI
jgi:hypothetical protein